MPSSPRRPSSTMRIFSSAERCRRVALRISRTVFSALSGMRLLACLIVAPQRGYDEPAILSYAISSFCPTSADGLHWLEAWVGGRHVVERVSGTIVVNHLLVGVVGSFQPDKLARAFQGNEDGMYGRFLYGWASTPDYRPLTDEVAEIEPELQSTLKALIRLPAEDADNVFAPQAIQLSQEAVEK